MRRLRLRLSQLATIALGLSLLTLTLTDVSFSSPVHTVASDQDEKEAKFRGVLPRSGSTSPSRYLSSSRRLSRMSRLGHLPILDRGRGAIPICVSIGHRVMRGR